MNPWAALIIVLALLLLIVAWKGTQDNVLSAVLNRPYQGGTGGGSGSASTASLAAYTPPPAATPQTFMGQPVVAA